MKKLKAVIHQNHKYEISHITFETEDGRQMFDVRATSDREIEIRAIDSTCVGEDKQLRDTVLSVIPSSSNSVKIQTLPYDQP